MDENKKILLIGAGAIVLVYLLFKGTGSSPTPAPPQVIYPQYSQVTQPPADNSFALANLSAQVQQQQTRQALGLRVFEDLLQYRLYQQSAGTAAASNSGKNQTQQTQANANYFASMDDFVSNLGF